MWLDDFAEFMAIKEHFGNQALQKWDDKKVVARDPSALEKYRSMLAEQIHYFKVTQYFFFKQWTELKITQIKKAFRSSVICRFTWLQIA
ncbi:4-alpha-glucanotransferase domain protein [Haemophilus pittmaniae HK 85]|uniref:4-alpha-glucanotransferase n=1 Tax=Haemophilus pittmaniae HK 85 TaxID=1035188 RepID=F9Q7S4_9PAST|nr:4-alpha-glucanotransferase [Haemophilus pittmaniae]EGV06356.1 4-alpha-glucanotransferase domain protein [Haemophilus pittmaniae HK 85]